MRFPVLPSTVVGAVLLVATPASADVRLTIANGHVSLTANNATVAQILAEWARVGQTRIVNAERLAGAPITIELNDVPEAQALDVVLRTVSGYLAAPRATELPNASHFDRIYLLPSSSPIRAAAVVVAQPQAPVFQAPPAGVDDDADADGPPTRPLPPPSRNPALNAFPQPRPEAEPASPSAAQTPIVYQPFNAPVGAATPGVPVPTPGSPAPAQPGR